MTTEEAYFDGDWPKRPSPLKQPSEKPLPCWVGYDLCPQWRLDGECDLHWYPERCMHAQFHKPKGEKHGAG